MDLKKQFLDTLRLTEINRHLWPVELYVDFAKLCVEACDQPDLKPRGGFYGGDADYVKLAKAFYQSGRRAALYAHVLQYGAEVFRENADPSNNGIVSNYHIGRDQQVQRAKEGLLSAIGHAWSAGVDIEALVDKIADRL